MRNHSVLSTAFALAATASILVGQSTGPDVIVGDLSGIGNYGTANSIAAFSVGTTSCNIGNTPLKWISNTNEHPVIGQNMYRVKNGRLEQIGMSWLKHGFTALAQSLCQSCNNPGTGTLLGVGCSDPYVSSLNGTQSGLGPRFEVNPFTGAYKYPFTSPAITSTVIDRRLRVNVADLDPAQNAGAQYFVEGQYVTPDDAAAGNNFNNASYRPCSITQSGATTYNGTVTGSTVRMQPAIMAWAAVDPTVTVTTYDMPGDGRFNIAKKVTSLGGGMTRYTYAVHNLNCDRAARSFAVDVTGASVITNLYFHDVPYHSGEPFDGTDWTATTSSDSVRWETVSSSVNYNANALRWGTTYTFEFETDGVAGATAIEPFKCFNDPATAAQGAYTLDTNAPYTFVDISAIGTNGPSGDNVSLLLSTPFPIPFFNGTLTTVRISTNGYITTSGQSGTVSNNATIPSTSNPNTVIAPFWDDLTATAGAIKYATVGTAPNRRFVVHWNGVTVNAAAAAPESFECIIEENGSIWFTTVSTSTGGIGATRGIEDQTGANGILGSFNQATAVAGTSWKLTRSNFYPPTARLTRTGDGSAGNALALTVIGQASKPVVITAGTLLGPTFAPPYGRLELNYADPSSFVVLADGVGMTGAADPNAVTSSGCDYTFSAVLPVAVPSLLTVYFEAIVFDGNAPGGYWWRSNVAQVTGL